MNEMSGHITRVVNGDAREQPSYLYQQLSFSRETLLFLKHTQYSHKYEAFPFQYNSIASNHSHRSSIKIPFSSSSLWKVNKRTQLKLSFISFSGFPSLYLSLSFYRF